MTEGQTLTAICDLAEQAGDILLKSFQRTELDITFKKDAYDPVTQADRQVDDFLRAKLKELFPGDEILSEENLVLPPMTAPRIWMVDPLDGTKDFVKGRDCFGVIIGLLEHGIPTIGCVALPARGQVFYASKGGGAFCSDGNVVRRLLVSAETPMSDSRFITRFPSAEVRPFEELTNQLPFKEHIVTGGVGNKICLIADGLAEAHINTNFRVSKWDTCGAQVILEEAGGTITDLDGKTLDYTQKESNWGRSIVVTNGSRLNGEIVEEMKRLSATVKLKQKDC